MDLKATALLKLVYLEMFGYDMSWASFNVLEVMSSAKYLQKRVGYLGAVQSFRPDTEVLMLATNLLKKDLGSASIPTMSLPILTLPHIITSSLALSLLTDLLPRLSHSHPAVRKKTVVTLYRLALVYPETLRVAWPKIKERLMDDQEDSTVTAAVINVVCELGWRRPHDFLPLAPRLFELLIEGGNNWMAIKIIKLFATLTPLEPRLVRKLLRPLINIIETTSAMSLLYECINGVIQGGILDGADNASEGDKIANLCLDKLRGMIIVEGDPNLKYVALLAFNRIVVSHPDLVSMQQDVIMDCLDDHDISIGLQALELVSGMVNSDNMQSVVSRLLQQLQGSPMVAERLSSDVVAPPMGIEPAADSDGENPEEKLSSVKITAEKLLSIPNEYRREVVSRILGICSRDTYTNIVDFEWYVDTLVRLVRHVPPQIPQTSRERNRLSTTAASSDDLGVRIGLELRNVAVRVKSVRFEATRAAESLLSLSKRASLFPSTGSGGQGVLEAASWIAGEYAEYLASPREALNSLLHRSSLSLPPIILCAYLQAVPKLFSCITSNRNAWDALRKSSTSLLLGRVVEFLEGLSDHPSLDVQERSIEFLELFRLAAEAVSTQESESEEAPLLLTSAIPGLFVGMDLNPVAVGAQRKVPQPDNLDLDVPINANLSMLLLVAETVDSETSDPDDSYAYYNERVNVTKDMPSVGRAEVERSEPSSYQNLSEAHDEDPETTARRRAGRRERNKDDPFYIAGAGDSSGRSSPFHQVLKNTNGDDFDIDAIPIIDLDLDSGPKDSSTGPPDQLPKRKKKKVPRKVEIAADETIDSNEPPSSDSGPRSLEAGSGFPSFKGKVKRNVLQVDSSGIGQLSLDTDTTAPGQLQHEVERREAEEAEIAKAMADVERLRLEMQRASERIEAQGIPSDGTLVQRKKKKKATKTGVSSAEMPEATAGDGDAVVKKKRKKKTPKTATEKPNVEV